MADKQVTIEQISTVLEKALKPVHTRLDGIESEVKGVKRKVASMNETLTDVKIDLDVIKEDYIGQIRTHPPFPEDRCRSGG